MKRLFLFITIMLLTIFVKSQVSNTTSFYVNALKTLIVNEDSIKATTQISENDTIMVTKDFLLSISGSGNGWDSLTWYPSRGEIVWWYGGSRIDSINIDDRYVLLSDSTILYVTPEQLRDNLAATVIGPASAENLNIAVFNGTSGDTIADGTYTIAEILNLGNATGTLSEANIDADIARDSEIPEISDIAYDATTWDGNTDGATKNVIRDKIESLPGGHEPVTIGTANGLSLNSQELSLGLASTSSTGALSNTDWDNFNGKQDALTTGNLTENVTGLEFDNTRQVIGGAAQLSLSSGYLIPSVDDTTRWGQDSEMVYPSAGIPLSTGTAWGTSITDNSANWNTAYGWGDHSTQGYITSESQSLSDVLGEGNSSNNQTVLLDYDGGIALQVKFGTSSFEFVEINGTRDLSIAYGTYGTIHSEMFKWQDDGYTLIYAPIIGWSDGTIEGAIRYDKYGSKVFQGYNGTSWVTFGGGSSLWTSGTYGINYNGNVGIGTSADQYVPLTVTSTNSGYMLEVLNSQEQGSGMYIEAGQYNTFNSSLLIKNNTPTTLFDVRASGAIYMPTISSATTSNVLYFNSSTGLVTYGAASSSGSTTFLGLTDTPSSYTAGKWLKVNSGGTALEFTDAPSGSSLWTASGSDIYYSTGKVLIGDNDDWGGYTLQVHGPALITDAAFIQGTLEVSSFLNIEAALDLQAYSTNPPTPPTNYGRVYYKTDGKLYFKNESGTEYDLTDNGSSGWSYYVQTLSTTTPTLNANSGLNAKITLTGNTDITFSNLSAGMTGNLTVTNAVSAYTLEFSGYTFKIAPSLNSSAGKITMSGSSAVDVLSWYYDGTYVIINGTLDYD